MKTVEERLAELEEKIKYIDTALKAQMALNTVRAEWEEETTGILKDIAELLTDTELSEGDDRSMMS